MWRFFWRLYLWAVELDIFNTPYYVWRINNLLIYIVCFQYVDLDEFLSENGVSMDGLGTHSSLGPLGTTQTLPKRERSPSPSDCMSPDTMNPPSPADSSESMKLLVVIDNIVKTFYD